jgi:hypothetical protein
MKRTKCLYKFSIVKPKKARAAFIAEFNKVENMRYATAEIIKRWKAINKLGAFTFSKELVSSLRYQMRQNLSVKMVGVVSRDVGGKKFDQRFFLDDPQSRQDALEGIKAEIKRHRYTMRSIRDGGFSIDPRITLRKNNYYLNKFFAKAFSRTKSPLDTGKWVGIELEASLPIDFDRSPFLPFKDYICFGTDGSVSPTSDTHYGGEVRLCLPMEKLRELLPQIVQKLRQVGAVVNRSCGMHVHLDYREGKDKAVEAYQRLATAEALLLELVPTSRKGNNYCRDVRYRDFAKAEAQGDRYHTINAMSYHKYHTIEVRLFGGTLNEVKIMNWIELLYAIADGATLLRCPKSIETAAKRHWNLSAENLTWVKERLQKFGNMPLGLPVAESELVGSLEVVNA